MNPPLLAFTVAILFACIGCSSKPSCTIPANISIGDSFIVPCDNGKAYQVIVREVPIDRLEVKP